MTAVQPPPRKWIWALETQGRRVPRLELQRAAHCLLRRREVRRPELRQREEALGLGALLDLVHAAKQLRRLGGSAHREGDPRAREQRVHVAGLLDAEALDILTRPLQIAAVEGEANGLVEEDCGLDALVCALLEVLKRLLAVSLGVEEPRVAEVRPRVLGSFLEEALENGGARAWILLFGEVRQIDPSSEDSGLGIPQRQLLSVRDLLGMERR